jgi:fluoride exporter
MSSGSSIGAVRELASPAGPRDRTALPEPRESSVKNVLLVALGGMIGSVSRYTLGGLVLHHTIHSRIPMGTVVVNVVGCLVAGVLAGLVERHGLFTEDARLFLFTGLLGGFTTFSAFGVDTLSLVRRGDAGMAAVYVLASVVLGLAAVWIGWRAVASWPR